MGLAQKGVGRRPCLGVGWSASNRLARGRCPRSAPCSRFEKIGDSDVRVLRARFSVSWLVRVAPQRRRRACRQASDHHQRCAACQHCALGHTRNLRAPRSGLCVVSARVEMHTICLRSSRKEISTPPPPRVLRAGERPASRVQERLLQTLTVLQRLVAERERSSGACATCGRSISVSVSHKSRERQTRLTR